jgi:hypothetical protein
MKILACRRESCATSAGSTTDREQIFADADRARRRVRFGLEDEVEDLVRYTPRLGNRSFS